MKRNLLFLTFIVLFSSCSTYYVSKINSPDATKDLISGDFVIENDSMRIVYNFFGENAPIRIDVQNKLAEPLYIDWQRSSLILGEHAISYMGDDIVLNGVTSSDGFSYRLFNDWRSSSESGAFMGTATLPRGVTFIPPHAKVEQTQLQLSDIHFENIPRSSYKQMSLTKFDGTVQKVQVSNFSGEESPLSFRSYLTFYVRDDSSDKPKRITFEHHFYVEEVMKMNAKPSNLLSYRNSNGDIFFIRKVKGRGVALATGIAAVGALGYLARDNDQQTEK